MMRSTWSEQPMTTASSLTASARTKPWPGTDPQTFTAAWPIRPSATLDDEESATYTPDEPTASIFAYASTDALAQVTAKQICPTIRQGKFRFAHLTWS